jgi:hypothetical protein
MYQSGGTIIRRIPLKGFDNNGAPIYRFTDADKRTAPAPFNEVHRLIYYPETDVMYVAGYTTDHPNPQGGMGPWKEIGSVIARYDSWSSASPALRYQIITPWINNQVKDLDGQVSVVVAGEYVFTCGIKTRGVVRVYNATSGAEVGAIEPDSTVGGVDHTGWVDIPYGMSALKRPNGEYVILVEEDWKGKILMYRWCPSGNCPDITVAAARGDLRRSDNGSRSLKPLLHEGYLTNFSSGIFDLRGVSLKARDGTRVGAGCYIAVHGPAGAGCRIGAKR